ncbi:MAG: hypothetical protein HY721_34875 [Planctomycetes bacterium]|nr:hypothetical protein [Planctomycetota bacterium]
MRFDAVGGSIVLWVSMALAVPTGTFAGDLTRAEYEAAQAALPYAERFTHATEALTSATAGDVTAKALRDVLAASKELGKHQEALDAVDVYLAKTPAGSPGHQDAFYGRARLLHRKGEKAQAEALFAQGIAQGWKPLDRENGFWAYKDSLWENDPPRYAVEVFKHALADPTGETYTRRGDCLVLLGVDRLWPLRRQRAAFSAAEDILPQLDVAPGRAALREIAAAVLAIVDGKGTEAAGALAALEERLAGSTDPLLQNERRNLPLYQAAARLLGGSGGAEAHAAMEDFVARNADRPEYTARKLMTIAYALERGPQKDRKGLREVMDFLAEEGFTSSTGRGAALPARYRLHLMDMHVVACFQGADWQRARELAGAVVAQYDPAEEAANNSRWSLGHIQRRDGELQAAEATFLAMIAASPPEKWKRAARSQLIEIWIDLGRPVADMEPLAQDLRRNAPPSEVEFFGYRDVLQRYAGYRAEQGSG